MGFNYDMTQLLGTMGDIVNSLGAVVFIVFGIGLAVFLFVRIRREINGEL